MCVGFPLVVSTRHWTKENTYIFLHPFVQHLKQLQEDVGKIVSQMTL